MPGHFNTNENQDGAFASTKASDHVGVFGSNESTSSPSGGGAGGAGVFGLSVSPGAAGVFGANNSPQGVGVQGNGPDAGVRGFSKFGKAIHGTGGTFAGFFEGGVNIEGGSLNVTKIGEIGGEITAESIFAKAKHFIIDHPCDPENKYLLHASVESSEMMTIYAGQAVCDRNGEAVIELPDWFQGLNDNIRYQLTCIGAFSPVYIAEKVRTNRFKIAGGQSGLEVSWQLIGVRQDTWAIEHPLVSVRHKVR